LHLAKIITSITLRADKFKDRPLNQPLIAPNSHENPEQHSQQGMSNPGEKVLGHFSFFFLFQQAEDRTPIRIRFCDILDPEPVENFPTICCTEKNGAISPCWRESAQQIGEHHSPCSTPLTTHWDNNLVQPWCRLNPPPQQN
jgi:hypothetical protein